MPYLIVVVGLACLLLLLVFRSILVPVKATADFLLSVVATVGAVAYDIELDLPRCRRAGAAVLGKRGRSTREPA